MKRSINARTVLSPSQRHTAEGLLKKMNALLDTMDSLPDQTFEQLDLSAVYEELLDSAHGVSVLLDDELFKEF